MNLLAKLKDKITKLKYYWIKFKNRSNNKLLEKLYPIDLISKVNSSKNPVLITKDGVILTHVKVCESKDGRKYIFCIRPNTGFDEYFDIYYMDKFGKVHGIEYGKSWEFVTSCLASDNPGKKYDDCHSLPILYCNIDSMINLSPSHNVSFYTCDGLEYESIRRGVN